MIGQHKKWNSESDHSICTMKRFHFCRTKMHGKTYQFCFLRRGTTTAPAGEVFHVATTVSANISVTLRLSQIQRARDRLTLVTEIKGERKKQKFKEYSCETQMILTVEDLAAELNKGGQTHNSAGHLQGLQQSAL